MLLSAYFTERELRCHHCGLLILHPGFLEELNGLHQEFGRPMVVLSCCRCKLHNDTPASKGGAGGHPRSLHVCNYPQHPGQNGTLGLDVATPDGEYRGHLFEVAWRRRWSIGWNAAHKFLHLDKRVLIGLPQTSFDY